MIHYNNDIKRFMFFMNNFGNYEIEYSKYNYNLVDVNLMA